MRTLKWNGEYWYIAPPLRKRLRMRVLWIGGWEKANAEGWRLRTRGGVRMSPMPVRVFNRLTFFGWGCQLRTRNGWFVYSGTGQRCAYFSVDGTPSGAVTWYFGAPPEVERAADEWRRGLDARRRLRGAA